MTEKHSAEPQKILVALQGKTSERKLRLFAVACAYQTWPIIIELPGLAEAIEKCDEVQSFREALETAEAYADGTTTADTVARASDKLALHMEPLLFLNSMPGMDHAKAQLWAMRVIAAALHEAADQAAIEVLRLILPARQRTWLFNDWRCKASPSGQADDDGLPQLLHEIFHSPAPSTEKPGCFNPSVTTSAQSIYDNHSFEQMLDLANALVDAGCTNQAMLAHCRGPGPHVRGCWALDLILGKS